MTTRTLKFMGTSTNAHISVTLNTEIVFDGLAKSGPELFELCDFPMEFAGFVPMTVRANSGTVTMAETMINGQRRFNPIYTDQSKFKSAKTWNEKVLLIAELANPAFSSDEIEFLQSVIFNNRYIDKDKFRDQDQLLYTHGCNLTVRDTESWAPVCVGESRFNVFIDGQLQSPQRAMDENGTWHWTITAGSVLSFDLLIGQPIDLVEFMGQYHLPKLFLNLLTTVMPMDKLSRPDIKVLDIGTGQGQVLQQLRNHGFRGQVHGIDSPTRPPYYESEYEYTRFQEFDLRHPLPIQDNIYDLIVCSNVFVESVMQTENDPPLTTDCLDEILRILVPGGIFVFTVDRFMHAEFDHKLAHLTNIRVLQQQWVYDRDQLYMFLPNRLFMALLKIPG